jgi:hypothetical protein
MHADPPFFPFFFIYFLIYIIAVPNLLVLEILGETLAIPDTSTHVS